MFWLYALCAVLALTAAVLAVKLALIRKAAAEIRRGLAEKLEGDTNTLLSISTRDAAMRALARDLNLELRELRRQRRQYENGDRALREAVTNVSHDLRTPLTALCGYLELLERRTQDPDAVRYLALIGERAEAMKRLSGELLRYSVAAGMEETPHPEPVDLNAAVEAAVASFYGALTQRGITPTVALPAERVIRSLDRAALERVLGNLLGNALKYSGGDLAVSLSPAGCITLSNAAPGLDEVTVGRLFDRFYTVETGSGSTGLGLSIARVLTERMGGTLSAQYLCGRLVIRLEFAAP